jgi:hypothetical protein
MSSFTLSKLSFGIFGIEPMEEKTAPRVRVESTMMAKTSDEGYKSFSRMVQPFGINAIISPDFDSTVFRVISISGFGLNDMGG